MDESFLKDPLKLVTNQCSIEAGELIIVSLHMAQRLQEISYLVSHFFVISLYCLLLLLLQRNERLPSALRPLSMQVYVLRGRERLLSPNKYEGNQVYTRYVYSILYTQVCTILGPFSLSKDPNILLVLKKEQSYNLEIPLRFIRSKQYILCSTIYVLQKMQFEL